MKRRVYGRPLCAEQESDAIEAHSGRMYARPRSVGTTRSLYRLMSTTWKTVIIVSLVVAFVLMGAMVFYGYSRSADANATFPGDGYVLQVSDDEAERVWFAAGKSYADRYPSGVCFTDVQGAQVEVHSATFLHYTNDAIGAFTDGILLDMEDLGSDVTPFFRMGRGSVVTRAQDGTYSLSDGDADIPIGTVLYKLSESTYLIASDRLTIRLSDASTELVEGYVEITYMDSSVIRIVTENKVFYTIASASEIVTATGLRLCLAEKRVRDANDEIMFKLSEMLLDTDAAIEILPGERTEWVVPTFNITTVDGEDGDEGEDGKQGVAGVSGKAGENGTGGTGGTAGASGSGGASGATGATGGTAGSSGDTSVVLPDFLLTDFAVTDTGFTGGITIGGNYDLLTDSDAYNKIYVEELATGRKTLVDSSFRLPNDSYSFVGAVNGDVSLAGLKLDTRYRLVIQSAYEVDGVEYERVFLSKEFRTDSIGASMENLYATETSGTIRVTKKAYSTAVGVHLSLYRKADFVSPGESDPGYVGAIVWDCRQPLQSVVGDITFSGAPDSLGQDLTPNTEYIVVLRATNEGGLQTTSQDMLTFRTLKTLAVLDAPVVVTDQRNSVFTITPKIISDPHNGIKRYSYAIYNALTDQLVKTVKADSGDPYTLVIDGFKIERDVFYKARLIAEFDDNEKTVELTSAFSNSFIMRGTGYPYATFTYTSTYTGNNGQEVALSPAQKSSFSRVNGMLYINFNGAKLRIADNYHSGVDALKVTITSLTDYSETRFYYLESDDMDLNNDQFANGFLEIPIERNGLKADASYLISVRGTVDLGDGTGYQEDFLIGNCVFTTANVPALQAMWSTPLNSNSALAINLHLAAAEDVSEEDAALAASTLTQMTFSLYVGSPSASNPPLKTINYPDQDSDPFVSSIGAATYGAKANGAPNVLSITERFFGLETSELPANATGFTVVVSDAIDYSSTMATPEGVTPTNYVNKIPIENNSTYIHKSNTPPAIPDTGGLTVTPIYNINAVDFGIQFNAALESTTVVGYKLTANFSNEQRLTRSISYYAYENTCFTAWKTSPGLRPGVDTGALPSSGYIAKTTVNVPANASSSTADYYAVAVFANTEYTNGFVVPGNYITLGDYAPSPDVYGAYSANGTGTDLSWGRGWTYFFAFDAAISLTNTETANHTFPYDNAEYDGTTILGKLQNANYQKPIFTCYPSTSANASSTWAYYLTDVDKALPSAQQLLVTRSDTTPLSFDLQTQDSSATAQFVTLSISAAPNTRVSAQLRYWERIYDRVTGSAALTSLNAFSYKQLAMSSLTAASVGVTTENNLADENMIRVKLTGGEVVLSNIPGLLVVAHEEGNTAASTQFYVSLTEREYNGASSSASAIILASDLRTLSGNVLLNYYALYDTNVSGFDFSPANKYAIAVANADTTGVYMIPNSNGSRLIQSTVGANDSLYAVSAFTTAANGLSARLTLNSPLSNYSASLPVSLTAQGVRDPEDNARLLTLKKLSQVEIGNAAGTGITITTSVPFVNMSQSTDMTISLDRATLKYKIEGTRAGTIRDDTLHISLFQKSDPTSQYSSYEEIVSARKSVSLTYLDTTPYETTFMNLAKGTDYMVSYWVEIATGDSENPWRQVTLLQTQDYTRKAEYYFKTVSSVLITNAAGQFAITSYTEKLLMLSYTLSEVVGFDIEFELYEQTTGTPCATANGWTRCSTAITPIACRSWWSSDTIRILSCPRVCPRRNTSPCRTARRIPRSSTWSPRS